MTKSLTTFLALAVVVIISGCGYTTGSTLSSNLKTIHVTAFKNKVSFTTERERNLYFPLLEVDVQNEIIDRFLFDGNLKIADVDSADLVLKGELINYDRQALRFTDNDDVQEYRVYIYVNLELVNTDTGLVMWREQNFEGEATYFLSGSQATTESSAVQEAVTDLARRVVERTIENW